MRDAARRTAIIEKYRDPAVSRILEIGALDSPTFVKERHDVKYVDYASKSDLARLGAKNPRYALEKLVDVDYVALTGGYRDVIHEKFDVIVANHVIEHVPDAIGWLHDLGKSLASDGILFLSVPDKRFTFDIARRETNFIDLLRSHLIKQKKPDFLNLLDHFWNHKTVKAADVLAGRHHDLMAKMRFSPKAAIDNALALSLRPYADVHVHVFTEASFLETFNLLRDFGFLAFRQMAIWPLEPGLNEFNVVLGGFQESLYNDRQIDLGYQSTTAGS